MNVYFNSQVFFDAFPELLSRLPYTLGIVLVSVAIGSLLGILLTCLSRLHYHIIQMLITAYVWLMRGTPLLLLLFVSYYGLPMILEAGGVKIDSDDPLIFALVAFSLSLSAFFTETMRAGFDAVDSSQIQAAQSLSLPRFDYYRRIIIPQALINSLPNLSNLLITAIKQSSILFTIGIMDIYEKATTMSAENYGLWQLEIFLALMLIYWAIAVIIDKTVTVIYRKNLRKVA